MKVSAPRPTRRKASGGVVIFTRSGITPRANGVGISTRGEELFHYTFLAGQLIGSENPALLGDPAPVAEAFCRRYGIRRIMTLTEEHDPYDIPGVVRYHLPLTERFSSEDLRRTFPIIDSALARQEPTWVHCQRGIDRTGCVIGGYLVARGYPAEEVIERLLTVLSKQIAHPQLTRLWKKEIELIRACGSPAVANKDPTCRV